MPTAVKQEPEQKTVVIFRRWPSRKGSHADVLALFPTLDYGHGLCWSYEHVGQHGGADYPGCIQRTRPATPTEYAALVAELTGRGYDLKIQRRFQRSRAS